MDDSGFGGGGGEALRANVGDADEWCLFAVRRPEKLKEAVTKDPVEFALFLGTLSGGYKAVHLILRTLRGKDDGWNSFIAGFISGGAMYVPRPLGGLRCLFLAFVTHAHLSDFVVRDGISVELTG